jgi:hypothetical protein
VNFVMVRMERNWKTVYTTVLRVTFQQGQRDSSAAAFRNDLK